MNIRGLSLAFLVALSSMVIQTEAQEIEIVNYKKEFLDRVYKSGALASIIPSFLGLVGGAYFASQGDLLAASVSQIMANVVGVGGSFPIHFMLKYENDFEFRNNWDEEALNTALKGYGIGACYGLVATIIASTLAYKYSKLK